jgi:hypothetical protein
LKKKKKNINKLSKNIKNKEKIFFHKLSEKDNKGTSNNKIKIKTNNNQNKGTIKDMAINEMDSLKNIMNIQEKTRFSLAVKGPYIVNLRSQAANQKNINLINI